MDSKTRDDYRQFKIGQLSLNRFLLSILRSGAIPVFEVSSSNKIKLFFLHNGDYPKDAKLVGEIKNLRSGAWYRYDDN